MSIDGIRDVMKRTPFIPFTVRMISGTRVPVPHPDFAMLSRSGRRLFVVSEDDHLQILDTLMIEAIETADTANGS